tara:strand:+ start:903 stop:1904 length:1002 start_codon:yes stop_codon:yes gene_type:complete
MEFFNKKEDVIDLQLTQFGRNMLSKGKFKPVYYSFFDDNILYNSDNAGLSEKQNRSEERIKEAQTLQPQIGFSSLDKESNNNYNLILSGETTAYDAALQRTSDREYMLSMPIGTSDINAEYAPSWSVIYLNGSITGSNDSITLTEKNGGSNTLRIPQLETSMEVVVEKYESSDDIEDDLDEFEDGPSSGVVVVDEEETYILLKVLESNGFFQKKNFDIEFFEIQEEIQGDKTIELLRPLNFSDNIDPESHLDFLEEETPEVNKTHVEYYFDVFVDDEIDDQILCDKDAENKKQQKLGVFADPRTKLCQDVLNQQKKKVFDIYGNEADSPGEIC